MGEGNIQLNHIALYVTNLERSKKFYETVLHMTVSEPLNLREQSSSLKVGHTLITHGPPLVRNLVSKVKPAAYQQMYRDICYCSAADGKITLILVQQTHPEKGHTISVSGNTIYGFSYQLSAHVDTDDLGWDLYRADIPFEHGDASTDGLTFSPDRNHSLYIRDPDGRMIELVSSEKEDTEGFLTGTGHIVLYVDDIAKISKFYHTHLGLLDITPDYIPKDPWKKKYAWLGIPGNAPIIILYQVTNPDGTRIIAGGYGLDHFAIEGIREVTGQMSDPHCVIRHPPDTPKKSRYLEDPTGYCIELPEA